jgi:hypothetical protein
MAFTEQGTTPTRTIENATEKLKSDYLVDAVGDLANITALCAPGSMAHTAGYALMWELGLDGTTWVAL